MDNYVEQSIYECSKEDGFDWDYYQYLCDIQPDEPDREEEQEEEYWED